MDLLVHCHPARQYLNREDPPTKYKVKESVKGKKKKPNKKATRNTGVHDFSLFLSSHVVYGKCTLMLAFSLEAACVDVLMVKHISAPRVHPHMHHMHTHVHTHTCITHIHTCTPTHASHAYTRAHPHAYTRAHPHIHTYILAHIHSHIYAHAHTHTHTHSHSLSIVLMASRFSTQKSTVWEMAEVSHTSSLLPPWLCVTQTDTSNTSSKRGHRGGVWGGATGVESGEGLQGVESGEGP